MSVPFEPRRFQSTIAYYARYRLGYPASLVARVTALAGLAAGDAVLDLGTGPGSLAVPFAQAGLAVTAMDPEPLMLEAAGAAAADAGVTLTLRRGSSYDLEPGMGPFWLVTIGRAFHWMDRAATLAMLDRIVAPGGGVALFHDAHPPVAENAWFKVMRDVGDKYGRLEAPHIQERKGGHRRYEPFLFASAFSRIEGLSVTIRQALTMEDIVGRALSTSVCSPQTLGDRQGAFAADLRQALAVLAPDGNFTEIAEMVCVLARRPEPGKNK